MPIWAWVFLLIMAVFFSFRLASSLRTGVAKAGPFRYDRQESSYYYWFFVFVLLLGAAYSDGLLLIIVAHQLA